MPRRALLAVALGVASVLMMAAAAHDRGQDHRPASVEGLRDLGKRYAAANCHCHAASNNAYLGCLAPQDCGSKQGVCTGNC